MYKQKRLYFMLCNICLLFRSGVPCSTKIRRPCFSPTTSEKSKNIEEITPPCCCLLPFDNNGGSCALSWAAAVATRTSSSICASAALRTRDADERTQKISTAQNECSLKQTKILRKIFKADMKHGCGVWCEKVNTKPGYFALYLLGLRSYINLLLLPCNCTLTVSWPQTQFAMKCNKENYDNENVNGRESVSVLELWLSTNKRAKTTKFCISVQASLTSVYMCVWSWNNYWSLLRHDLH